MQTLGLRHAAINVSDAQKSKAFYMTVLKMELEWEPDAQNIYLTSGGHDNLALHEFNQGVAAGSEGPTECKDPQRLDHLGFMLPTLESVDEWYAWMKSHGVPIEKEIKSHRDGARSFYLKDPDGVIIQMIYHPPIANRAAQRAK